MKMVLLTFVIGISAWAVLDYFQTRTVRGIFLTQLKERLNLEAQEDRIRFDNYIKAYHQSVKLLASQRRLIDYIGTQDWTGTSQVVFHRRPPLWLPRPSVLRALVQIRYALLLDEEGMTREVYQGDPEPIPGSLLHPTALLRQLSHNQSFMTSIDGKPFLVTSEAVRDSGGQVLATLMLASPLDKEFLIASQGQYNGRIFALLTFALVTGEKPSILISTDPGQLPAGTLLKDIEHRYLITGKSLFDYGASDLLLGFASFISVEKVESLTHTVILKDRQHRAITVFLLISAFALIMFWITKRIGQLSARVSDFSQKVLHGKPQQLAYGDEIDRLEERFQSLTEEVVASQEIIRRDYYFQSTISSILTIALEPISLEVQLDRIMDAILTLPFLSSQSKGAIFLVEDKPEILVMKAQQGMPRAAQINCAEIPFGKCLCGLAASKREIVFADCLDNRHEILCEGMTPHGHYCVPIMSGPRVLGTLDLYIEECQRRNPEEEKMLTSVANTLAGIIEHRHTEQEKQKLQEELIQTEKLSALGRLTANVAHEIRTPLTLVGGFARRLNKKLAPDDSEKKYVDIIISEVSRLEKILMNVLSYSKEKHLNLESHSINEIIDESLMLYSDKLTERSIQVRKSLADVPEIMIDKPQIIGTISDLISNAIDSMLQGGTLTIATKQEIIKDINYLKVKITDTGAGIPADKLSMIFEPFFTTKVLGRGTGLGLSICKRTVEDHGGFINVESEVGVGSSFSLYFPYKS
jgi:signal transduction histidine kinase/HAMP domain-containing protein